MQTELTPEQTTSIIMAAARHLAVVHADSPEVIAAGGPAADDAAGFSRSVLADALAMGHIEATADAIADLREFLELELAEMADAPKSEPIVKISIYADDVWATSGGLDAGIIEAAGVLGGSQDAAESIYEAIEEAIAAGEDSVAYDDIVYTWSIA